jgi:hypothetical protein
MLRKSMSGRIRTYIPIKWRNALREPIYLTKFSAKRALARRAVASKITRIDNRDIPLNRLEIRAFMVVRNESLRLPFMLSYYFKLGIDRIFVLDNDSSDDTRSIVLSYDKTHLFHTKDIYAHHGSWVDLLLRRYGRGCWCLVVDADEMFIYPDYETVSLRDLCHFLDRESFGALDCVLLDMYPDGPLSQIKYEQGADPLHIAPWFDRPSYVEDYAGPHYVPEMDILHQGPSRFWGGMRKRVFDVAPCVSKFPLIKFNNSTFLSRGTHWIQGGRVADLRGALLHFKYLDDFSQHVQQEVARGQRVDGNEREYNEYAMVLRRFPELNLRADVSVEFHGTRQLVALGIMKRSQAFEAFTKRVKSGVAVP